MAFLSIYLLLFSLNLSQDSVEPFKGKCVF